MNTQLLIAGLLYTAAATATVAAAVSAEGTALGNTLTPVGAERAGNKAGTIPSWAGGYTKVPGNFVPGGHYPDPFKDDQLLFTITGANSDQYQKNLSPGQIALLKRYPNWKMKVYPTRRSAAFPAGIYAETKANLTRVNLVDGGRGFTGTSGGFPFPIPKQGVEAIWNHISQYRGDTFTERWAQAAVTETGDYTLVKFYYEIDFGYGNQRKRPAEREDNLLFYFLQIVNAPPRLAGSILLVHEYTDQVRQPRKAWTYNPGQRRVRLAPNVGYDNPGTAADGLRTNDDFGMYNGSPSRYDWTLAGKRELYVPYNAYTVHSPKYKIKDVLQSGHINPDLGRYELHRVWVVEANLKEGTTHIYKRRTFYLDEDSWAVLVTDKYDKRDQLWRVAEDHRIPYYDVPMMPRGMEVHHDLQSGRYIAMRLSNEEDRIYEPIRRTPADFTPNTLRDKGTR